MTEKTDQPTLTEMIGKIVSAYVSRNAVPASELPAVIKDVASTLRDLSVGVEVPTKPQPAVPIKRSVTREHLVCLVCGKKQKMLKRHLATAHKLNPAEYREMFGLRADYPMTAPNYSKRRSETAKKIGLGTKRSSGRRRTTSTRKKAA